MTGELFGLPLTNIYVYTLHLSMGTSSYFTNLPEMP